MGFVARHKGFFINDQASRLQKLCYVALTSGLCGSITTFATWNVQCNQACFFDTALLPGSYIAARIIALLICLWTCMAISMQALRAGHHLASLSPHADANRPPPPAEPPPSATGAAADGEREWLLVLFYVGATAAVVAGPLASGRPHLAAAAALGAVGAFTRLRLSALNARSPEFPVGTLLANALGTWILAGVAAAARLALPLGADPAGGGGAAATFGLAYGLCGCLSTVSTLASELDALPPRAAYVYAAASFGVAQIGVAVVFDAALSGSPR
jgi:fluoride ion exporter CrcB/FEX